MTHSLEKIFASFFTNRAKSNPLVIQKGNLAGWLEQARIEAFDQIPEANVSLKKGLPWDLLTGKVYEVFQMYVTAILALYSDETILWLDDHSSNSDYEIFMRRENLLSWYPDRKDQLIQLLVETKFNFLGRPRIISSAVDIPHQENEIEESHEQLMRVTKQIFPPTYVQNLDGSLRVHFCIWTLILGKIFAVDCMLGPGSAFSYHGELLTRDVGDYVLPR